MIHWQLTSQQFEAALFAIQRDRLPYPIWNSVHATDEADLGRQRHEAIEALLPRVDDDLARLLHTLAEPAVRIHVHGRVGGGTSRPADHLRGYASFGPAIAAVTIQARDPEPGISGEVTVSLCSHRQAELLLARMIGEVRPGRHKVAALKSELDVESEWSGGWNRPPTPGERVEKFFSRPKTSWGEVLCYPGPFLDNRTDGVDGFLWMDFPRDGRYYVREDGASYTATPMGHDEFVNHLDGLVWRVHEIGLNAARNQIAEIR